MSSPPWRISIRMHQLHSCLFTCTNISEFNILHMNASFLNAGYMYYICIRGMIVHVFNSLRNESIQEMI